ncbi:MAG: hypothetical protein WCH10_05315 [bacterium]
MKAPKPKNTKKRDIKQKKTSKKPAVQTVPMVQMDSGQLENYKTFFQYLLSNDDNELADES